MKHYCWICCMQMMQIQNLAGTCECTRLCTTTSSGRECQFTYNIIDSTCKQVYLLYMNHTCKMQMVQKAKFPEMYRTGRNFLHLKSWSFAGYRCTKVYRKLCPILLQDGSGNVMFFGESAGFQACTAWSRKFNFSSSGACRKWYK